MAYHGQEGEEERPSSPLVGGYAASNSQKAVGLLPRSGTGGRAKGGGADRSRLLQGGEWHEVDVESRPRPACPASGSNVSRPRKGYRRIRPNRSDQNPLSGDSFECREPSPLEALPDLGILTFPSCALTSVGRSRLERVFNGEGHGPAVYRPGISPDSVFMGPHSRVTASRPSFSCNKMGREGNVRCHAFSLDADS